MNEKGKASAMSDLEVPQDSGEGPVPDVPPASPPPGREEDLLGLRIAAALIDLAVLAGLFIILSATVGQASVSEGSFNVYLSGLPAISGATAAIAAAGKAIKQAVAEANGEIDQVNADVTQAYSVANGMATGSCSGDGPGHVPAQISHISSK
jgi:hypothetical protein